MLVTVLDDVMMSMAVIAGMVLSDPFSLISFIIHDIVSISVVVRLFGEPTLC